MFRFRCLQDVGELGPCGAAEMANAQLDLLGGEFRNPVGEDGASVVPRLKRPWLMAGAGSAGPAIPESLAAALKTIDRDSTAVFVQFVDSCLVDPQAKQMWRDLMTAIQYFWRHPPAEQVREARHPGE